MFFVLMFDSRDNVGRGCLHAWERGHRRSKGPRASAWERQKASSVTNWSSKDRSFRSRRRHSAPADKGAWEAVPNEALRWLLLGSELPVRSEGEHVESGRVGAKRARKGRWEEGRGGAECGSTGS